MGKPFCKMECLNSCLIILDNKVMSCGTSALAGWNRVEENVRISCLVALMLRSQRLQGGLPGKRQHCLAWRVPRRNICLPDHNFIPLSPFRGDALCREGFTMVVSSSVSSSKFWYCFLLWPQMLEGWETFCGCVGKAPPSPSPNCREVTWHSSLALTWIREVIRGIYCFLWSISVHGCCLSRGTKGLSCSQVRQQVLNPDWGTCYGFALLSLLPILQLFWGFINPVTWFTAWRISIVFCNWEAFM